MNRRRSFGLACAAVVLAACGSTATGAGTTTTVPPTGPVTDCVLPSLSNPRAGAGSELGGPAVSTLHGGAARVGFRLDGGKFILTPPEPGDEPLVSANQAECAALASSGANGYAGLDLASAYGVAVGYGRVSIAPALIAAATNPRSGMRMYPESANPTLPAATPYQRRLAWVVVMKAEVISSGGGGPSTGGSSGAPTLAPAETTTTQPPAPPSYDYVVFVMDARTGSDALEYNEGQPFWSSVPWVTVPIERVSVPWTLISRAPDGYSGQISATMLACDGVMTPVLIDRGSDGLAVVVERPVGAECSRPKQETLRLVAAEVTADLPATIVHDPLGPVVTKSFGPQGSAHQCEPATTRGAPPLCHYAGPGATQGVLRTGMTAETATPSTSPSPMSSRSHRCVLPSATRRCS
jgi:hypothetical protein